MPWSRKFHKSFRRLGHRFHRFGGVGVAGSDGWTKARRFHFCALPQDFLYHGIAAFFYLSASVALAKVTMDMSKSSNTRNYKLDISAVVSAGTRAGVGLKQTSEGQET